MTRRRRTGAPALVVISWRDIPAQVGVTGVDTDAKAMLPSRFQRAIDKAAKIAGMSDHHAYVSAWRRTTLPLDSTDPARAVEDLVARLDAEHDRDRLAALVRQGGLREAGPATPEAGAGPSTSEGEADPTTPPADVDPPTPPTPGAAPDLRLHTGGQ